MDEETRQEKILLVKSSAEKHIKNMLVCFPLWEAGGQSEDKLRKVFSNFSSNKDLLQIVCAQISIPLYASV